MTKILHILLIEHGVSYQKIIEKELQRLSVEYTLTCLHIGKEHRNIANVNTVDCILYCCLRINDDWVRPDIDLTQFQGGIPFIVITKAITSNIPASLLRQGVHDCLLKDNLWRLPLVIEEQVALAKMRADTKQHELFLREAKMTKARLELFLNNTTYMISIHSSDGSYVYVSPACRVIVGYEPEELIGTSGYAYLHPDEIEMITQLHQEIFTTRQDICFTHKLKRKDNTYIWVESVVQLHIDDATDEIIEVMVTIRDITELKKAQDALSVTLSGLEKQVAQRTKELSKANRLLKKKIIEHEASLVKLDRLNTDILDSIAYAKRLQDAALPDTRTLEQSFTSFFIFNKPKHIVSGDFYWFYQAQQKISIVCADSTGHGVPGAFMSLMGIDIFNRLIIDKGQQYPSTVLKLSDLDLINMLKNSRTDHVADGIDLAYCLIDLEERTISFAGAMNPIVLIGQDGMNIYRGSRFALGDYMDVAKKQFETIELTYNSGDMLYMFSDGYQDQFGGPKNKKFTPGRLYNMLKEIYPLSADEQKKYLEKVHNEWKGTEHQVDDILVLGLRLG